MIPRPLAIGAKGRGCNGARAGLGCRHPRYSPIDGRGHCMRLMRRLRIWAGSVVLRRNIAIALAMAALASGIATYLALTESPPFGPDPSAVLSLLNLDLVLLLLLGAVVAWRLVEVWAERRRGLAGSRLQIRLVLLFSLFQVIPTIIVAGFSFLYFSFGV